MTKTIDIIRKLRSLPMTQAEISNLTGIPQPRICRWEAGSIPVGADDALKLQSLLSEKISGKSSQSPATIAKPATEIVVKESCPVAGLDLEHTDQERRDGERREAQRREAERRAQEARDAAVAGKGVA